MNKSTTTEFIVVLVEPKYGGNVGAVARAMMNFDFQKIYLIKPCDFDNECYARAMHAASILDNAEVFSSFDEAIQNLDYCVATSSIVTESDKKHLRNPMNVDEFLDHLPNVSGKIGLIFGREDYGLFNEEIAACDIMINIPTSDSYLSLNLSHAVTILLSIIYSQQHHTTTEKRKLGNVEKEKLHEFFSLLLEEINYPEHKKEKTKIMFRRLMGRSMPSTWEYHTLMGVLSKANELLKKTHKNRKN